MNWTSNLQRLFVAEGAIMILLGAIALLLPPLVGVVTVILLGWLLMASGMVGLIATLRKPGTPGFWWALLSAIITGVAGIMLFLWPLGGLISLSVALGLFLALDGLFAVGLAFEHRRHLTPKWFWLMANGLVDVIFAVIIFLWLPSSAIWALGLFIGADMVISGVTLIVTGIDIEKEHGQPILANEPNFIGGNVS